MKTNNEKGRNMVIAISAWIIVKTILNAILGAGLIANLIFDIIMIAALLSGLQFVNYAVGGLLAILILSYLPDNITHFPKNIIYLAEAVIDAGCVYFLFAFKDVKEHFTNKWSEVAELFNGSNKK